MYRGVGYSLGLIRGLFWLARLGYSYLVDILKRTSILMKCSFSIIFSLGLKRLIITLIFINIILIFLCLTNRFRKHITRSY